MKNLSPETAKPEHITAKRLAIIAMVAAAYFALTVLITPLSYGMVQFRFSEILVLLCFYKKDYCYSMAVGCLLANLFSP
ncbi:MAG: QueT transporter family protein, partial [Oscillospiraceae bacterium]